MKKVKYKITTTFGDYEKGIIIDAYMICNDFGDDSKALLYHPKDSDNDFNCSSLEFCKFDYKSKAYISIRHDSFINITNQADKIFSRKVNVSKREFSKEKLKNKLIKIRKIVKNIDI